MIDAMTLFLDFKPDIGLYYKVDVQGLLFDANGEIVQLVFSQL